MNLNQYLAIDGIPMIRRPHRVRVRPGEHRVTMTADQRPQVQPGSEYSIVECTWGRSFSHQDVLSELRRRRANEGVHSITFQDGRGGRENLLTVNAFMGNPSYSMLRQLKGGKFAVGVLTIEFVQIDTPTVLFPICLPLRGILTVTDAYAYRYAPASGSIFDIDGRIRDLGAGAGQTRIQVSNNGTDYLSTPGDFVCAPPEKTLQNAVLIDDASFAGGDKLDGDIKTIPAGGLSKDALIILWCWLNFP